MALGDPRQDDIENPPVSIVAPWDLNIDPSTIQFAPSQYMQMAEQLGSQPAPSTNEGQAATASQPLLTAIQSGYADKKVMGPVDDIRKGVMSSDQKLIEKGQRKLVDALTGGMSFGERFADLYLNTGRMTSAHKMAADVVMNELLHPGSTGGPQAEEASRLGLIKPEELLPGAQTQPLYGHLIPQEPFGFTPEEVPLTSTQLRPEPAQPGQEPGGKGIVPGARLTPFQQGVVESRQKAIQSGLAYKTALATSRGVLAEERAATEREKRKTLLPTQVDSMKALNAMRIAQTELAEARVDWYQQLPDLRRELASGASPFELQALTRVHKSIQEKQPIDRADWLIAERWLRKGSPRFSVDFMGRAFDRLTGQSEKKGGPFGWLGLPEPPSTSMTEDQQAEAKETDEDLVHQFSTFLGSLLRGVIGTPAPEVKTEPQLGGELSASEKAELERLRKKHGGK